MSYDFNNYQKDTLTKPRDLAWSNWKKFEKVGDKVSGYVRDAFFRPAEGIYKDQRGITLQQEDGTYINVGNKRLSFILDKTDSLHVGDPLTIVFESEQASTKGNPTKIFAYYGKNLDENKNNPTIKELDAASQAEGGAKAPVVEDELDKTAEDLSKGVPFP